MVSEGNDSLVDTGNGCLVLLGMNRAKQPADESHPFGHGKSLYVWTNIVGISIFGIGIVKPKRSQLLTWFVNVYNTVDGCKGTTDDPESVSYGKRKKKGWKNSGAPWTYYVDLELIGLPNAKKKYIYRLVLTCS